MYTVVNSRKSAVVRTTSFNGRIVICTAWSLYRAALSSAEESFDPTVYKQYTDFHATTAQVLFVWSLEILV